MWCTMMLKRQYEEDLIAEYGVLLLQKLKRVVPTSRTLRKMRMSDESLKKFEYVSEAVKRFSTEHRFWKDGNTRRKC